MATRFSVCVIGNSHVAALKLAWTKRALKVCDGLGLTFFSAQNHMLSGIRLKGRALVPVREELAEKLRFTSDGLGRIDLDRYDAFVVVASGFGIDVPKILRRCGTVAHRRFAPVETLVSAACFDAVLEQTVAESCAIMLIDMIRRVSRAPVVLVAAPFMSERLVEDELEFRTDDPAPLGAFVEHAKKIAERVAAARQCEPIWQDESTVALPGFTRKAFNRNPVRFTMRTNWMPAFDDKHGNEDYGHLAMTRILDRLDEMSGGRVRGA